MTEIWEDDPFVVEKDKQIMKEKPGQDNDLIEKQEFFDKKKRKKKTADNQEETGQDDKLTEKDHESGNQYLYNQTANTEEKRELKETEEQQCGKKRRKWCTVDLKDLSFTGLIRKET
ncbi:Hypothetical predicted protein, partial [Mytilus galloprovincialis]